MSRTRGWKPVETWIPRYIQIPATQALCATCVEDRGGRWRNEKPYRGGAPAVLATVSGETDLTLIAPGASLPQIAAKRLRPLATGGPTREAQLPDVPTTAEAGFPDFKATQWVGLLATGGTPKPIVDQLNAEVARALRLDSVKAGLEQQGMTAVGGAASDFRALIAAEIEQWTAVARKANIKME